MQPLIIGKVRVSYVQLLIHHLETEHPGLAERLLSSAKLEQLSAMMPSEYIPITLWNSFIVDAIDHTKEDHLALILAKKINLQTLGVFSYAAMTCRNLGEVASILVRYERLIDDMNDTRLVMEGNIANIEWIPRSHNLASPLMQLSLATWVTFARLHSGRDDISADAEFTCAEPKDLSPYWQLFGGKVTFNAPVTRLRFPVEYLNLPVTYHDPQAHSVLLAQAQNLMDKRITDNLIDLNIRERILELLPTDNCTIEEVAKAMGLTTRTLQYQLELAGTGFRQLLGDIRFAMAKKYLADKSLSLAEISFLLGYSEQSPFNKAFKRWSGMSPGQYRKTS